MLSYLRSFAIGVGYAIGPCLIIVGLVILSASPARAAETSPPPDATEWPYAAPYRIGAYGCLALHTDQGLDPCVFDPDPVGDPVPVEPDNDIVLNRDVPRGVQPNGSVAVSDRDESYDGPSPDDSVLSGHDCRTSGNGVCGPANDGGFTPGCYNRNTGAFVLPWRDEWATDRLYRPLECGRPTARDLAQNARLSGQVGRLCADTESGTGRVCWFVDQPRPRVAHGPAEFVS